MLLYFSAEWCKPCKAMEHIVNNLDIEVIKIDVDEKPEITREYDVQSVPTFILLDEDVEVDRIVGTSTKEALEAMING